MPFRLHSLLRIKLLALFVTVALSSALAHAQECEWLERYVKESMPPPSSGIVIKSELPAPHVVRDVFPRAPEQITFSIHASSDAVSEWHDKQKRVISSVVADLGLPIDMANSDQNPHIIAFLFEQGVTAADTPRVVGQFQKIPNRPGLFPEYSSLYDAMVFNRCWTSWTLTPDARLRDVTIFIPFDGKTGELVAEVRPCVRDGLLKAFGVGLNRDGWVSNGQKSACPECDELDKRMARVLYENNRSAKTFISAREMLRRLAGPRC